MGKHGSIDHTEQPKNPKPTMQKKKKPMKITYISSPTMVKATSPSEFRAIVQELTGKDSKIVGDFSDSCTDNSSKNDCRFENQVDRRCCNVEMEYDYLGNVNNGGFGSFEMDEEEGDLVWRDVSAESFFGNQSTTFVFV